MRLSVPALALMLVLAAPASAEDAVAYLTVRDSPLAGFRYNDGKVVWDEMRAGDPLALMREYHNPFDANAISLEWNGRKIGYVPRQENSALARELDAGKLVEGRIIKLAKSRNGRHLISYDILIPLQTAQQMHGGNK